MGYSRENSKAASKTPLASLYAEVSKGNLTADHVKDTLASVVGKLGRPPADLVEYSNGSPHSQDNRCRVDALRLAFVADKEEAKEHAYWRNSEWQSRVDATHVPRAEGADAAIFSWVAAECNRVLGHELTDEEENLHAGPAPDAEVRKLNARGHFKVREPSQ